jgi:hypothetical protein
MGKIENLKPKSVKKNANPANVNHREDRRFPGVKSHRLRPTDQNSRWGSGGQQAGGIAWIYLERCVLDHPFASTLTPLFSTIFEICRSNGDLRGAVDRLLDRSDKGDLLKGVFWPWDPCRKDRSCLHQFLDYVYFASDEFLRKVIRP